MDDRQPQPHEHDLPVASQVDETTIQETQEALATLSAEELLLLSRNADQFRHYINKKAKRLRKAKLQETSITSEGETQP